VNGSNIAVCRGIVARVAYVTTWSVVFRPAELADAVAATNAHRHTIATAIETDREGMRDHRNGHTS
jgi:hypothetical protein